MGKKYISENRYKKSIGKKRRDISAIRKANVPTNNIKIKNIKKKRKSKIKPNIRMERRITKRNVLICIILVILILVILRALLKEEGEPFIPIFFGSEENTQVITVGIVTDKDLLDSNINNVILKELEHYTSHILLRINQDYSINYDAIASVEKTGDKEYIIYLNKSKEYSASTIKRILDGYISDTTSIYHLQLKDVQNMHVINEETLKITLKNVNPYFIYNLDIPVIKTNKKQYVMTSKSTGTSVEFERTRYASKESPLKIVVKRYNDMYAGVEAYKKGTINMLVTNQKNVQNMLGKYEYNIKSYRNGETIFLLPNPSSQWLKDEVIRKVVIYGIDRNNIVKDVMQSTGNVIDLPYIYDNVKYKYDIYAVENLLLSNGYKKQNNIYSKNGKQVELNLIVNREDEEKQQIATAIKNNLSSIGIKINVEKLSQSDIQKRIDKGNYDLVLSTVTLNNKPDITFIENDIYITEEVQNSILNIEKTSISKVEKGIYEISKALSNSISCFGILAKTNYVIYSKDIGSIGDIGYFNVFGNLIK